MKIFFVILLGMLIYQLLNIIFPNNYFPSIFELMNSFVKNFSNKDIYIDIINSLLKVSVGFFIASIIGIILGLVLGSTQKFKFIVKIIEILRPIPPIAWIPIAIIIFGLGNLSAYFIVFLGAFFPIFTNTYFGALSLPLIYKNTALSFEISHPAYFFKILLFNALPNIFTGLKIGIGMAWMSVIAAELIGSQSGLGYFIQLNRLLLRTDNILIGMITIGVIGNLLQNLIEIIRKKSIYWE
ncbi:MAG: ABC transporter permease subunit [Candidatus Shapirobacteria bacterium]|nr:ABC transporter permease subunit [Candidatus Shapirobacteria bacterium]